MSVLEVEPSVQTSPSPGALAIDSETGIAWLRLDDPGRKVNTLSSRLFAWFEAQVDRLERERPAGLVIYSGKPDGFVAGADLEELLAAADKEAVLAMLQRGHDLMERLAGLPFPTVAAIHGACLGGGLELALACRRRAATEHPKTRLGLPEVQLGLIPGLGGTQRLPRLVGVPAALDLILTGRAFDARRARTIGLVDAVCHPASLREAALRLLADAGAPPRPSKRPKRPLMARAGDLFARTPLGSHFVGEKARAGVLAETGGHYPAPLVALAVVKDGLKLPLRRALDVEAGAFSELVVAEPAKSLMSIFFARNAVEARAARASRNARPVETVAVLGAGLMGAGIAQVLAEKGVAVLWKDRDLDAVARGMRSAGARFAELARRWRLSQPEARASMARLHPAASYAGFARADLAVEAVFEDLEVKRQVLREVEAAASERLVFASNTSAIPIARIAEASRRPESVVGMHFFSPVHRMQLLEVVRQPRTSPEALATAVAAGRRMGKTVIVVNDGPGFFTSRVLAPFLNEAAFLLLEGARIDRVDEAMTRWGWPVGPFALLDEVGLDVARHVSAVMVEALGERLLPPPVFARLTADGRLGRKAGRGFYLYGEGDKHPDAAVYRLVEPLAGAAGTAASAALSDADIAERCFLQMLNETARCMEDGVIADPADVDLGVILGFGFPAFRGGLLREADRRGIGEIVDRLDAYTARLGARFEPAGLLREMARRGERFHG